MVKALDLAGKRFGRWMVISQAANRGRRTVWKCHCDCGAERGVLTATLRNGTSRSCGCLPRKRAPHAIERVLARKGITVSDLKKMDHLTIGEAAKRIGVSRSTIKSWSERTGLRFAHRGGARSPCDTPSRDEYSALQHLTMDEVAEALGVHRSTVSRSQKRFGLAYADPVHGAKR